MGKQTNKHSTQQGNQQKAATTAATNTEPTNAKAAVAGTNVIATAVAATAVGAIAVVATAGNAATADIAQTAHNVHTADSVATTHNVATADNVVAFAIAAIPAITTANADTTEDTNIVNCSIITKSARTKIDNVSAAHAAASPIDATTTAGNNMETTTGETKINSIDIMESFSVDGAVNALVSTIMHAKKM
jgi:hypothetical protein